MQRKKLQDFKENFDNAISNIKNYLEPDEHAPHRHELALWLLETKHNRYSYLDNNYAMYMSDAEGFDMVLSMLHHALYDDGVVAFVTVNNRPRIIFHDREDENLKWYCLTESEKELEAKGHTYEVKVLDIKPNEFGPLYDAYAKEQELKYAKFDELIDLHNEKG